MTIHHARILRPCLPRRKILGTDIISAVSINTFKILLLYYIRTSDIEVKSNASVTVMLFSGGARAKHTKRRDVHR